MAGEGDEFTCAVCGETFIKAWPDEEALAEYHENFPFHDDGAVGLTCDGCYDKVLKWAREQGYTI